MGGLKMTNKCNLSWEQISKQEFQTYEGVRKSGVTNMWMVHVVEDLSGLDRQTIGLIMEHYSDLSKKYPDVRK
jgi:hypothetical protein